MYTISVSHYTTESFFLQPLLGKNSVKREISSFIQIFPFTKENFMSVTGIIAEFDPFHRGHYYLLQQARQLDPSAPVVVALSGHFTQRGSPAALRPHARTEMALRCGADLVVELPLPWAISSAEGFGFGGVDLLAAAGVTRLVFGSEHGDTEALHQVTACLHKEEYQAALKQALGTGISFAAARQRAVSALLGEELGSLLAGANNLLGISYLAAIHRLGLDMEVQTVQRVGAAHNAPLSQEGFSSASAIRQLLQGGSLAQGLEQLPEEARPILQREWEQGFTPAALGNCERAVLYRLRMMKPEDFLALPDCSEGLENRLFRAAQQATSLEEFFSLAKSKRYAHSRLRRLCLWAWLGMTAQDRPERVPYVRVLGMTDRGREVLRQMKKTCPLPVITKPAAGKKLPPEARRLFELEMQGADLWRLCLPQLTHSQGGSGWVTSTVIL
jgi:predicted nucleotidyltransferase